MRYLCLHGRGTSAKIFKSQTASFRYKLPHNHIEFDFVDGTFPSGPAAGISAFYSGPYYAWWTGTAVSEIRASHKWLVEYMQKNGPYDGVMCFSQGCSLIGSFLLYHALETPTAPLPFKVAIFICGGVSLPVVAEMGMEITAEAEEWDDRSRIMLQQRASLLDYNARVGIDPWYATPPDSDSDRDSNNHSNSTSTPSSPPPPPSDSADDLDTDLTIDMDTYFRHHHPTHPSSSFNDFASLSIHPSTLPRTDVFGLDFSSCPPLITIPTVHVYGNKDPRFPASIQMTQFCDPKLRQCYDHRGGHEIPRGKKVSEAIAEMVLWSAAMAEVGVGDDAAIH